MADTYQSKYQQNFHENCNCIIMNDPEFHAPVTLNAGQTKGLPPTSEKIKKALETLDKEGVLTADVQWWAIYRVLTAHCGYPSAKTDFCKVIDNLELDMNVKCIFSNWRNYTSSHLKGHVDTWADIKDTLTTAESNQVNVALKLMELLQSET